MFLLISLHSTVFAALLLTNDPISTNVHECTHFTQQFYNDSSILFKIWLSFAGDADPCLSSPCPSQTLCFSQFESGYDCLCSDGEPYINGTCSGILSRTFFLGTGLCLLLIQLLRFSSFTNLTAPPFFHFVMTIEPCVI